ncbi:sialidase family protein [Amycolatopsis sp. CA-230715]|uniref:sialidase family protein n=1 Tax=Amycolatopsis sp. CA-230715 TaxID=2745196 RepID=UPI001C00F6B5|nr:sialidase family protein [Amycolatopsis sp. CA-230715]QWF84939.1 hypothetical protein HUW46_08391 [Amycolatopsis sp. CA-230715]
MHRRRSTTLFLGTLTTLVAWLLPAVAAHAASTVRTFEDDKVGAVPAGCAAPAGAVGAVVSDVRAHHGKHSLRVTDQAKTVGLRCTATAQHGADLTLAVYPAQVANGFTYTLLGHIDGVSAERPVFQLGITARGALRWYDGNGWTQLTAAGTLAVKAWTTLRVQVPRSREVAYLYADDRYLGEAGPLGVREVTDITGFQVTGNGGDDVFVDDVTMGDVNGAPPTRAQAFTISESSTIDSSITQLQMPNTAVNVTVRGQPQTLVSYPAHIDTSDTAGNRLAVTTDNGATWADAQRRNPLPEAPSYGLTKLRNGDVLAVDYHTYMTPGSGNRSAEVPTAISHDNGQTWTRRAGVMTTPQAMRPGVSDRPGQALGGFVLVHSVIESPDGALLQSGYGYYQNDTKYRQIVLRSTDGGVNWTLLATVAYDPHLSTEPRYEGFCEGAVQRTADGDLLIVMRTGSYQQMYASRSRDGGRSWSTPRPLMAGSGSIPVTGIYPTLTRLTSGALVLWIGRPGQSLLVSRDGTGTSWTTPQTVDYRNSGNGNFVPLDDHHLLAFGDRGPNWASPPPLTYRVWSRLVTVHF